MEETLRKIKTVASGSVGLTSTANQVKKIADAASKLSEGNIKKLSNLATAIDRLGSTGNVKISPSIGRQLGSIADAANKLQGTDLTKLTELAHSLSPLSTLTPAHLTSYVNQLDKLPNVINDLHAADLDRFIAEVQKLDTALRPFGETMQRISDGFSAFPSRIQRLVQSTERYNETMRTANKVTSSSRAGGLWGFLNSAHGKYLALAGAVSMVGNTLGGFIEKSAEYSENLNLFTVAMGKYAEEAYSYAESVQAALGIDMSEWMRNQGIFMQIATGFGVIEDKAYTMSQGLTQIAYDIASFYNISTEEAMQKVQSGISGELEPLRRLGYALDAATLQQVAYDNGIKQNINTMTQAQKSQLRYVAIMEQSTNAMGDMARTIMSPANALRVVNMQLTQLERAMGNAILPLLMEILPYAQAAVMVLTDAINKLAVLFGFELPEIDYSGLGGLASGADDATGAVDETTEAVKELKNAMLGIDELNVISPKTDAAAGAGGGYDLPIDLDSYKFFDENYENQVAKIAEKIKEAFEPLIPFVEGFISVFESLFKLLTGFDGSKFFTWLQKVGKWMEENPEVVRKLGEIAGALTLAYSAIKLFEKIGELGAVKKLADLFGSLFGKTKNLTDAFDKKNKSLEKQTEDTLADAKAVGVFVGALGTALSALYALNGWLKQNPLTPELNPQPVMTASAKLVDQLNTDFTYAEERLGQNQTITQSILDLTAQIYSERSSSMSESVDSVSTAWKGLDTDVQTVTQSMVNTVDDNFSLVEGRLKSLLDSTEKYSMSMKTSLENAIAAYNQYAYGYQSTTEQIEDLQEYLTEYTLETNEAIADSFEESYEIMGNAVTRFTSSTKTEFQGWASALKSLADDLKTSLESTWDAIHSDMDDAISGVEKRIAIAQKLMAQIDSIGKGETGAGTPSVFDEAKNNYYNKGTLADDKTQIPPKTQTELDKEATDAFWAGQKEQQKTNGILGAIEEVVKNAADAISKATGAATSVLVPGFASGGYPDEGQLFIARERGAEMVGSIGGKTAVANNDQIVEAIRQGVYDAEMAARAQDDGDRSAHFYVDGEEVSTILAKKRQGRTLYKGGVI